LVPGTYEFSYGGACSHPLAIDLTHAKSDDFESFALEKTYLFCVPRIELSGEAHHSWTNELAQTARLFDRKRDDIESSSIYTCFEERSLNQVGALLEAQGVRRYTVASLFILVEARFKYLSESHRYKVGAFKRL